MSAVSLRTPQPNIIKFYKSNDDSLLEGRQPFHFYFLFSKNQKPDEVDDGEGGIVDQHECRVGPGDAVLKTKAGEREKYWRFEEIFVSEKIYEDVQSPAEHWPEDLVFADGGDY